MGRMVLVGAVALVLAAAGTAQAAKLSVGTVRQPAVLAGQTVPATVTVAAGERWRLTVRRVGRRAPLARVGGRSSKRLRLTLRPAGLRGCKARRIAATLRIRGIGQRTPRFGARVVKRLRVDAERCRPGEPGDYLVGAGVRDIAPRPEDGTVYLGGYGIGGGGATGPGRVSAGTFPNGIQTRAVAITAGGQTIVLADAEAQGWFAAERDAAFGLVDLRRAVAAASGGVVDPQRVVIQTNHSHSGPDLIGAWGGASMAYRKRVFEQTRDAILDAIDNRRPGRLRYGAVDARDLLSNQFEADPNNQAVDSELRVLQAVDGKDRPFVTIVNHNAHATVLGGSNTLSSGDWTTTANKLLERQVGGRVLTLMGTLGRTQPADRGCADAEGLEGDRCSVDRYAGRVVSRARDAIRAAEPLGGDAVVDGRSYLITDVSTAPTILGLNYVGSVLGAQLVRSTTPPWLVGNVLATTVSSLRIGDVLLSAMPGEAYPQIPLTVRELVPDVRGQMTMGLANDQLGYLIAPLEAYPEPIRRTLFNERGDEISPLDNDNYFFNVSLTMGERVTCALLRGAGEVLGTAESPRARRDRCALFADDATRGAGADVQP